MATCTCLKCRYKWQSRVSRPRQCPNCKRQDWKRNTKRSGK